MEDLRVLEQQQRDSQRLLASSKLTKQHKLEQRSSLDTKLSSLKYSNGEARAQLIHAREVLSKSTRELANAKLRSDRSSDNLKKFDEKLKKTLDVVRALHSKRRKLDNAIVRLANADATLKNREGKMMKEVKRLEMELEDAKHREQLVVKSIQGAKMKVQEFVEDTIRMRSELSGLETDLTSAQQMEASTKFRAESIRSEIEGEKKRYEDSKTAQLAKMEAMSSKKVELESSICNMSAVAEEKKKELYEAWEKCVAIQKEEGLEVSASPADANLNVDAIRTCLDDDKAALLKKGEEAKANEERGRVLEERLATLQQKNNVVQSEREMLVVQVEERRKIEDKCATERAAFVSEFEAERAKVQELRGIAASLQAEEESYQLEVEEQKEEMDSRLVGEKEKLVAVTIEIGHLDKSCEHAEQELEREKASNREKVDTAKSGADEAKVALDEVQKRADSFSKLPNLDDEEQLAELDKQEEERLDEITGQQTQILKGKVVLGIV